MAKLIFAAFFSITLSITSSVVLSNPAFAIDVNKIQADLAGAGAVGWIHGSVESQGIYVITFRDPTNFFDYIEMSLVSFDPAIQKQFAALSRHDQVNVKGTFLPIPAPQKHINVTSISTVQKYQSGYASDPYHHEAVIPGDLLGRTSETFLVHAIAAGGQILVVEYKDVVLPIFVKNGALTKNLFRGDVVQLAFKIQAFPNQPVHLNLDEANPNAVKVLDSILALHGKPAAVQGRLILFPKSPEISLNVFAVEVPLVSGLKRQYTLVNFDDPAVFNQILQACQKAWDHHGTDFVNGRNKLVANHIQVKVTGTFNEVSPSQANAQVLINSIKDLQIIEN
jgi:hypothetical protein